MVYRTHRPSPCLA